MISEYNNKNDALIREYGIDHIPLIKLREILVAPADDPQILKIYKINSDQISKLVEYIPDLKYNPTSAEYFYECFE